MLFAFIKAAISGVIIALISEIAKRSPALGALIASLPIISVLAMIWLWNETHDSERIAAHSENTFWLVLPSLPMFLILPALLRSGVHFYVALGLSCLITIILYLIMISVLKKFGLTF
ncbi:MAG: hypothetical protein COA45_12600 [Zetaproteobacteria bacterium]|nr:MAG: hypothetical protein COA45_12600 [Zetaproteobacteria bacterium]